MHGLPATDNSWASCSRNVHPSEARQVACGRVRISLERFPVFLDHLKRRAGPLHEDAQPDQPGPAFRGKSKLGNYSNSMLELDDNVGRVMDAIRAEAPNTIVIITADNGAWQDAWPDAGVTPFRGEKGSVFEGAFRMPGIMWAPGKIPAGVVLDQMMSHMDVWPTTAAMVGLTPPPHGEWVGNDGKPIYFDGIDNSAYVTGKSPTSARNSFIYTDGETFGGVRADIGGDPDNPDLKIAWKYL